MNKRLSCWLWNLIGALSLFIYAKGGYAQTQVIEAKETMLQGVIHLRPIQPILGEEKIQPGTPIHVAVTIVNKGQEESVEGNIYIRYAFTKPLDNEPHSILFQTEKMALPVLAPGEKLEIKFSKPQQLPSLIDFVREDWLMREYQAVVVENGKEHLIGSLTLTFSAYYYPGMKKDFQLDMCSN